MNPDPNNQSIKQLREATDRPVESPPGYHIVGRDGAGWYQAVGHNHDVHSNKAMMAELRQQVRQKVVSQLKAHHDRPQAGLFRMLELAIVRSDSAVLRTSALVGLKPSDGLYEKIKEILVAEDNLDPKSELWMLLGFSLE